MTWKRKYAPVRGRRASEAPEFHAWRAMLRRCNNPLHRAYNSYGGRGIKVCERWASFEAFFEDMGPRPTAKHTLEREDNNLGYCPGNCLWATRKAQGRNRRTNRQVTLSGAKMTVAEVAERIGVPYQTVHSRLRYGRNSDDAIQPKSVNANGRAARMVVYEGKAEPLTPLCRRFGISYDTVRSRLRRGWSIERALAKTNR